MELAMKNILSTVKLNDGVVMPLFGLGLYKVDDAVHAVKHATSIGYRMFDTAELYENEAKTGEGLQQSGIPRTQLFVVTKLLTNGSNSCNQSFKTSLQALKLDYIDLYLIHSPSGGKILETYDTMLNLKEKGLIRSVGVSNFGVHHLENLEKAGRPLPSINQIELHPWQWLLKRNIVNYCRKKGIGVMGYCPLARVKWLADPTLKQIAAKYEKSETQVLIRWSLQKGFITIPKSGNPIHMKENAEVFDFSMTDEEMKLLDAFPSQGCTTLSHDPTTAEWIG